ncbi:Wobble nucleotide-excising tRNase [Cupriavidus sp. YR651]|uniref:ATP-binding protein n=1 Tax=Cupriavidus sp. YR651 TaxID=1855315 RepID=UPI00088C14FC|nr:AAA family ATPase [Cupriavidus sp. YR651]SDC54096.1 Wobble nucleotide-excising tRNase [Cupriavidus sp. YR651]
MAIKQITKLQGYRIFRNFKWNELPDFGRYNLIYGWNGAGKTSLSTLFRFLQRGETPDAAYVELLLESGALKGADFGVATSPPIRVFNRDFVDRNVFEVPGHELPPVFYLGEDSTNKQKQVTDLLQLQDDLRKRVTSISKQLETTTADFNSFCTNQARSIRNLLLGDARYNNYEAPKFKELMRRVAGKKSATAQLDDAERKRLEDAIKGTQMPKLPQPTSGNIQLPELTQAVIEELRVTVVSSTIEELVRAPELADWVEEGVHLHSEDATHCKFCDQPLPLLRLKTLAAHFNDNFKAHQERLQILIETVGSIRSEALAKTIPERSALYPHLHSEFDAAIGQLKTQSLSVEMYLKGVQSALEEKLKQPFRSLNLTDYLPRFDFPTDSGLAKFIELIFNGVTAIGALSGFSAVQRLLNVVQKHNTHTDNFDVAAAAARAALEIDEGVKTLEEWGSRTTSISDLRVLLDVESVRLEPIAGQVRNLQREIRQHLKPAEELNREMAAYLGRDELRFEVRDTGYTIMRGALPAMHLSDGERTAIAFMYFLKTLSDATFDIKNGIVVIDDPVSSLDANSLYCAFGYMKTRTKDAKQIFILTHNFSFFRQVKNWFNYAGKINNKPYEPAKSKDTHFYMLAPTIEDGQRGATLRTLDPLLHEYESEYHYLFRCVSDGSKAAAPKSLAEVYGLPNIARRLLESFLSFRVPGRAGNLGQQIDALQGDAAAKARVVRFLHTHSHMEQVEADHDLSVLSEAPAVLTDLLGLIQTNDKDHFEAMMKII